MKELELIENVYEDAEKKYLSNIQDVFSTSRCISNVPQECNIPLPDGLPAKTSEDLASLSRLLKSTYVLASIRNNISNIEQILFLEAIERAKEAVFTFDNPVLRAYYLSSFNKLVELTRVLLSPDVALWES